MDWAPPPSVRTVLFDMGGVLIDWKDEWIFDRVSKECSVPYRSVEKAILPLRDRLQRGDISLRIMWKSLAQQLEIPMPRNYRQLWVGTLQDHLRVIPRSVRLAGLLRKRGFETGIFSNTDATHTALFRKLPAFRSFSPWLLSYEMGVGKPEPRAFRAAERILGRTPSEVLLIDDRPANVRAARAHGWSAALFDARTESPR